ncbi:hypothetical protein [Thermobifida fusca]|uniref:hypothetical protein n=1 Tax=Thermobifida fusca TaxID=2021 RepID=UPI00039A01A3|nr:hypothetical protein [Thermobifida fusca]QOS58210.1 hypothetical protein IM867_12485 [Thermobifida fusca]
MDESVEVCREHDAVSCGASGNGLVAWLVGSAPLPTPPPGPLTPGTFGLPGSRHGSSLLPVRGRVTSTLGAPHPGDRRSRWS